MGAGEDDEPGRLAQGPIQLGVQGKGNGSIVFYTFPQLIVDKIVERTGGRPVKVEVPGFVDGDVRVYQDGRVFLVDQVTAPGGHVFHREDFLLQITEKGELLMDAGPEGKVIPIDRVRPFKVEPGESQVRDGKLIIPGTQQRPAIPIRTV